MTPPERVRGMPYVRTEPWALATFDKDGAPLFWGIFANQDAQTGEKFMPPLQPEEFDVVTGETLYCGWTKQELRDFYFWERRQ